MKPSRWAARSQRPQNRRGRRFAAKSLRGSDRDACAAAAVPPCGLAGAAVNLHARGAVEQRQSQTMNRSFSLLAGVGLATLFGTVQAVPAAAPHAAACVAALKAQEADLAGKLKTGVPVGSDLLTVVRSGIAIIGTQYQAGLEEADARKLLETAEHEFEALPAEEATARQQQCLQEGQALYQRASALERLLITTAAQRRIKRLTAA
jgi:hypothetical protein